MSTNVGSLPAALAEAVARARSIRAPHPIVPFKLREPDPILGEWARDVIVTGALAEAIAAVAASDPELAS